MRSPYIETARRKAHDLKEYIDVLFDWFKLNSNEFALEIQSLEAAELTRNILIDWIPIFEDKQVDYDIDIPEQPVRVRLDMDSYMRIVNNLSLPMQDAMRQQQLPISCVWQVWTS